VTKDLQVVCVKHCNLMVVGFEGKGRHAWNRSTRPTALSIFICMQANTNYFKLCAPLMRPCDMEGGSDSANDATPPCTYNMTCRPTSARMCRTGSCTMLTARHRTMFSPSLAISSRIALPTVFVAPLLWRRAAARQGAACAARVTCASCVDDVRSNPARPRQETRPMPPR
jgi:hypothetical protein